ncbi:MAG: sulfite exporter TauE/SafE family protein [Pseudomonadota bacterium]|nr:sulfite exporter TauE/SafE family protein [Pseudomonadota bacterium]
MINEILLGLGVGAALGLTGSGGVLAVPALILGLGFSLPEAVPVSLIAIGSASLIGTVEGLRKGLVRYRAALVMAVFGMLLSPLGIYLSQVLPNDLMMILFCGLLFFIVVRMVRQARSDAVSADEMTSPLEHNCMLREDTGRFQWNPRCFSTLSGIGGVAGLFSGMLGVGGGFLIVPGVRHFSNLGMHGIVATSLAVITLISAGTITLTLLHGVTIAERSWYFIAATITGLVVSRFFAPRIPPHALQWGFAALASLVAVSMLAKTLIPMFNAGFNAG